MYREISYVSFGIMVTSLLFYINVFWKKRKILRKMKRGLILEKEASKFLKKNGYKVLDEQIEYEYFIYVDGEKKSVKIRPDYLVSKNFKRYIAEVKSGNTSSKISTKETRRQIMEYYYMLPCFGVLLVDMENMNIEKIEFRSRKFKKLKKWNIILFCLNIFLLFFLCFKLS